MIFVFINLILIFVYLSIEAVNEMNPNTQSAYEHISIIYNESEVMENSAYLPRLEDINRDNLIILDFKWKCIDLFDSKNSFLIDLLHLLLLCHQKDIFFDDELLILNQRHLFLSLFCKKL